MTCSLRASRSPISSTSLRESSSSLLGALELLTHVEDFDFGQWALLDALRQFQQPILALYRVVVCLQRGRGRPQYHGGIAHLRAHNGNVARVIARHFLLLVGVVVLFVHHDESQIGHWREDCRARTYHNVRLAITNALPLFGAFVVAERGVQNGNLVAEDLV